MCLFIFDVLGTKRDILYASLKALVSLPLARAIVQNKCDNYHLQLCSIELIFWSVVRHDIKYFKSHLLVDKMVNCQRQ